MGSGQQETKRLEVKIQGERVSGELSETKMFLMTLAGSVCLYSVAIIFFYYDWIFGLSFEVDTLLYSVYLNGALCMGAALTVFFAKRFQRFFLLTGIGVLCYAIALGALCLIPTVLSENLVYGSGVSAGIGAGILMPLWFERARHLKGAKIAYLFGLMSLVSGFLVLGINNLPIRGVGFACAFLLVISVVLLIFLGKKQRAESFLQTGSSLKEKGSEVVSEKKAGSFRESTWITVLLAPLIYVVALSFSYGMLDTVAMASETIPASGSGYSSLVGGIAADVLFLLYVRMDGKRYTTMLNVSLGVIATGLIFLPFLSDVYSVALVVLTHMAWGIALLVLFTLAVESHQSSFVATTVASATVFALPRPAVVLGMMFASALAVNNQYTFIQMTIVAFALLYLIFMGVVLLRTREKRAAERAIRRRDDLIKRYAEARDELYELACEEIEEEHRLTPREGELLKLLAQGRDAGYIEKELFLSRNTVKSYTKAVYVKLDVHSKQELIDYVKASLPID